MISVDNAVELMLKTFLGLPKRITGLQIGREKFREISESFPKLLDAIESHAPTKISDIDLGIIEWYHRLRNELYHQGNGLTVERKQVEVYAGLAKTLFESLFGITLDVADTTEMHDIGALVTIWGQIEELCVKVAMKHTSHAILRPYTVLSATRALVNGGILPEDLAREANDLRVIRNEILHAKTPSDLHASKTILKRFKILKEKLEKWEQSLESN